MNGQKLPKQKPAKQTRRSGEKPRLGLDIQSRIGSKLRAMYDDVVQQGVPDRFASLLRQFDGYEPEKEE